MKGHKKPNNKAQRIACERNWEILRLRGAASFFRQLGCQQICDLIDQELGKRGAKTEAQHLAEIWAKEG